MTTRTSGVDELIHTRTGLTGEDLLARLAAIDGTGRYLAGQLSSATYQVENLHQLLGQAITQAIGDLTAARTRLEEGAYAHLGPAGILQHNGQRVDLYAARLTDAWTHLTATVTIAARVLNLTP